MKRAKSITVDFFDFYKESSSIEQFDSRLKQHLDVLSSLTAESIYALDV